MSDRLGEMIEVLWLDLNYGFLGTEKLAKPLISMRCPRTIALFIASKMVENGGFSIPLC